MGNCRGKTSKEERKIPDKGYEEHNVDKRHVRLGFQIEKSPEGEIHMGLKGGLEHKKDKVVKVDENSDDNLNKIPKVLDIINDEQ